MSGGEPRPASWWAGLVPVGTAGLSTEGHARLLQMTYERIRFSISAIPAVAVPFIFYYRRFDDGPWLALWGLFYVGLAAFIWTVDRRYQGDRASLPPGYRIEVGGDQEESAKSQASIFKMMPLMAFLMILFLTNAIA